MDISLQYLLDELNKRLQPDPPQSEKLITSGRRFSSWVRDRIQYKDQIVINAIECPEENMQQILESVTSDIKKEFSEIMKALPLPYPFDDIEKMKEVIGGLIEHFKSSITVNDVIVQLGPSPRRNTEITGYLILTIISSPVIV